MTRAIDFFYDFRSPYSYLAYTQLRGMDVELRLRPMRVLEVMDRVGNVPTTIVCKAKGQYARVDLARWAGRYGIPLKPSDMKVNDGEAMARAVLAAPTSAEAAAITLALYRAIWSEGTTLPDSEAVLSALNGAGIDTSDVGPRIDHPDTAALLTSNTDEAVSRGVFGAPTFFVGDAMFFGNDRIDFLREELSRLEEAA